MSRRDKRGFKIALLWVTVLAAFGVAFRRAPFFNGSEVSGPGWSGVVGAPFWSVAPLFVILIVTIVLTVRWLLSRDGGAASGTQGTP